MQGGSYEPLRRRAVEAIGGLDLPGHSIGGLAVGEPKPLMYDITELVAGLLPADRPRYLMGVGKPTDLVEAVARGVDLFDCVLHTRNARNGQAFTPHGPISIGNARFARDGAPLDPECACEGAAASREPTCATSSRPASCSPSADDVHRPGGSTWGSCGTCVGRGPMARSSGSDLGFSRDMG